MTSPLLLFRAMIPAHILQAQPRIRLEVVPPCSELFDFHPTAGFRLQFNTSERTCSVSISSDAQAFLRPAGSSYPGVIYPSLNCPQTKNAILVSFRYDHARLQHITVYPKLTIRPAGVA